MALEDFAQGGLGIAILMITVLIVGGVIAIGLWLYFKWKNYQQFEIEIWQQDGLGQFNVKYDKGGIFVDSKTKNKRLFLKKHNVGLNPDNVPFMPSIKGKRKVLVLQTGLKNFRYIKPKISQGIMSFEVGEEDVNWAINSYERQKKLFGQTWLAQYMPFIMIAFVSIIILIMFINLFKVAPSISDAADALREAAIALRDAKAGTVIL